MLFIYVLVGVIVITTLFIKGWFLGKKLKEYIYMNDFDDFLIPTRVASIIVLCFYLLLIPLVRQANREFYVEYKSAVETIEQQRKFGNIENANLTNKIIEINIEIELYRYQNERWGDIFIPDDIIEKMELIK
jgi:hypothetical protein